MSCPITHAFIRAVQGPQPPVETIGRCEACGLVDHHLQRGLCPDCKLKAIDYPTQGYRVGEPHPSSLRG